MCLGQQFEGHCQRLLDIERLRRLAIQELQSNDPGSTPDDYVPLDTLVGHYDEMILDECERILGKGHYAEVAFTVVISMVAKDFYYLMKHPSIGDWLKGVTRDFALLFRTEREKRDPSDCRRMARRCVNRNYLCAILGSSNPADPESTPVGDAPDARVITPDE